MQLATNGRGPELPVPGDGRADHQVLEGVARARRAARACAPSPRPRTARCSPRRAGWSARRESSSRPRCRRECGRAETCGRSRSRGTVDHEPGPQVESAMGRSYTPPTMKISVLGSGAVGQVLADGFLSYGDTAVMRGSREPGKLAEWQAKAGAKASDRQLLRGGALRRSGGARGQGHRPPSRCSTCAGRSTRWQGGDRHHQPDRRAAAGQNGVLSLLHHPRPLARWSGSRPALHAARFVKAFSCVGNALMVNPGLPGGPPSMFICGNDAAAKAGSADDPRPLRLGDRGPGRRRGGARHRAAVHPVVRSRLPRQRLGTRAQDAAGLELPARCDSSRRRFRISI